MKKEMNRIWLALAAVVMVAAMVAIAACQPAPSPAPSPSAPPATSPAPKPTATSPTPSATPSPTPAAFKWPAEFRVTTAALGSTSNAMLSAIAPVLEKSTGMRVRIIPEDNIPLKARQLAQGMYDCMDQSAGEVAQYSIQAGQGGYATKDGGPYQVRIWYYLYDQVFGVFVKGDSGIKTVQDFKGKRVALWQVPGGEDIVKAVLAVGNLTTADVTLVPIGSYPDQMDSIVNGKADVVCVALPSASNVQKASAAAGGISFIDLDPAKYPGGLQRFNGFLPVHTLSPITVGVKEAIGKYGWASAGLAYTRQQTDPELVYNLLKWFDANYDTYKGLHVQLGDLNSTNLRKTLNWMYLPVHDGVIKYFKEKGQWTADDDLRQQYNVALVTLYVNAFQAAVKEAEAKGMAIDAQNKAWLDFWAQYKKDKNIPIFKSLTAAEIKDALPKLPKL